MIIYTSITKSYLPKARVLANSLKQFHPDWEFILLYSDDLPENFNIKKEPFDEILLIEDLKIPNFESWVFKHNIVELCTAVKGIAAELLAKRKDVKKIMYLDPDIKVFNSLKDLDVLLDKYDILLTPHILDIEQNNMAIIDNEISALKYGIFNLGFFAANTSGQGLEFIKWWSNRLQNFCFDDIPNGLFTDQKWCDLAPVFFNNLYIIRDRGYNVATWNIAHRPLNTDNKGVILAKNTPLRFYHFTGYDSGAGSIMLKRYANNQPLAFKIWDDYEKDLNLNGHNNLNNSSWKFANFENGEKILTNMREIFRKNHYLQNLFPNPYIIGEKSYLNWWKLRSEKIKKYKELLKNPEIKVVFFGASSLLNKIIFELNKNNLFPSYICDNNILKHGKEILSYKVFAPNELFNKPEKYFVIITSSFFEEIKKQLKDYKNIIALLDYKDAINLFKE